MTKRPDPQPKSPPVEISGTAIGQLQVLMSGLPNIELTNPQDGDILQYDAAAGKWTNGSSSLDLGGPI